MATIKRLEKTDITSTKVLLHENIPITGSIISGTYVVSDADINVKNYAHGMFQSVYDYPYLSSSANHIFDITYGVYRESTTVPTTLNSQSVDKHNIYDEMGQILVGYDITSSILPFRESGSYIDSDRIIDAPVFINFSRLLTKDEIKKGDFRLTLGTAEYENPFGSLFYLGDFGATSSYNDTNSPAGEFGLLRSGSSTSATDAANNRVYGVVYYQAGLVVLDISSSLTDAAADFGSTGDAVQFISSSAINPTALTYTGSVESGTIDQLSDALRHRIYNIDFNNSSEINSTIYFCRAANNEFNYSSNPTYLSSSQIIVKENNPNNSPFAYVTSVGLYADDGALLATAKLSEPLKKTPANELTVRVRLDY